MAERFVEVDRDTPMLLPADLRAWVPEDDLVHFVLEAVATLPTGGFVANERGTGHPQYPPSMMLALLIYCYANGIFASRRIERATYRDLGVRYLTGDTHPDHDTVCTFRRENVRLITKFFVRVLELADLRSAECDFRRSRQRQSDSEREPQLQKLSHVLRSASFYRRRVFKKCTAQYRQFPEQAPLSGLRNEGID